MAVPKRNAKLTRAALPVAKDVWKRHVFNGPQLTVSLYTWPGSSWRPSACGADVIATRPQVLVMAVPLCRLIAAQHWSGSRCVCSRRWGLSACRRTTALEDTPPCCRLKGLCADDWPAKSLPHPAYLVPCCAAGSYKDVATAPSSISTCGLVAMTSAQHAEGRQFDPGQV